MGPRSVGTRLKEMLSERVQMGGWVPEPPAFNPNSFPPLGYSADCLHGDERACFIYLDWKHDALRLCLPLTQVTHHCLSLLNQSENIAKEGKSNKERELEEIQISIFQIFQRNKNKIKGARSYEKLWKNRRETGRMMIHSRRHSEGKSYITVHAVFLSSANKYMF